MAAPEDSSQFTVHIFLSHDPIIARALLPELFSDFPDSTWKLAPLIELPPRPRRRPERKDYFWEDPREVLGRYVFSKPVAGGTTLLQLSEKVEREFAIPRKYQGQFTIFPQRVQEEARWDDHPLPWNMTLAEVRPLDLDAPTPCSAGSMGTTNAHDPVLRLVLETKAAALMRIVGNRFLEEELGEPYRLFQDMWDRYSSFWNAYNGYWRSSRLKWALVAWRKAKFAFAYLAKKGHLGPENDELRTTIRMVDEIREMIKQSGVSQKKFDLETHLRGNLLPRVRQIEANEANGQEQLRELSVFVTQWEDWITNRDFQNFAIRLLEQDEVESKVASVLRQRRQVIDAWKSSEGRRQLQASIANDYYAARPWLTEEDRARAERYRLESLERTNRRLTIISGDADSTTTGNSLVPSPHIQAHSIRCSDGKLLQDQSAFTVSSGSLLWGQIVCQYSSMTRPGFTRNANHIPPELEGGTIIQHQFSHRAAARNGQWKVRLYSANARVGDASVDTDAPEWHAGWILCHEDVDPMNVLERVRALDGTGPGAVSHRNLHTDKVRRLFGFRFLHLPRVVLT